MTTRDVETIRARSSSFSKKVIVPSLSRSISELGSSTILPMIIGNKKSPKEQVESIFTSIKALDSSPRIMPTPKKSPRLFGRGGSGGVNLDDFLVPMAERAKEYDTIVKRKDHGTHKKKLVIDNENILDVLDSGIIVVDLIGTVIFINRRFTELFGWTKTEVYGFNGIEFIIPSYYRNRHTGLFEKFSKSDQKSFAFHPTKLPVIHKDGSEFCAGLSFHIIRNESSISDRSTFFMVEVRIGDQPIKTPVEIQEELNRSISHLMRDLSSTISHHFSAIIATNTSLKTQLSGTDISESSSTESFTSRPVSPLEELGRTKSANDLLLGTAKFLRISLDDIHIIKRLSSKDKYGRNSYVGGSSGCKIYMASIDGFKCICKDLSIQNSTQEQIASFEKEVYLLNQCRHPNIVRYYFHRRTKSNIQLFMQQYDGTLFNYLGEKSFSLTPDEIKTYMLYICRGVVFLHKNGIVHHDLNSGNIFYTITENLKIANLVISDFDTSKSTLTHSVPVAPIFKENEYHIVGTPGYIAPEIFKKLPSGIESDIFSVGILFFELMTLKRPFMQLQSFELSLLWESDSLQQNLVDELRKDENIEIYEHFIPLWTRCINIDPKNRPTAEELVTYFSS